MKFLLKSILIAVLAYFAAQYFLWYSIVVAAFFGSMLIRTNGLVAFLSGFVGIGLLWLSTAWIIDYETGSILTDKVAQVFSLPGKLALIFVTGLIGGIAGGFGALTGTSFRQIFESPKRTTGGGYYS